MLCHHITVSTLPVASGLLCQDHYLRAITSEQCSFCLRIFQFLSAPHLLPTIVTCSQWHITCYRLYLLLRKGGLESRTSVHVHLHISLRKKDNRSTSASRPNDTLGIKVKQHFYTNTGSVLDAVHWVVFTLQGPANCLVHYTSTRGKLARDESAITVLGPDNA